MRRKGVNSSVKPVSETLNLSQLRFHQIKDKELTKVRNCEMCKALLQSGFVVILAFQEYCMTSKLDKLVKLTYCHKVKAPRSKQWVLLCEIGCID